jgi:DNA-binding transcriptional LysR family regulator
LALQGIGIVRLTRLTVAQAVLDGRLVPLLQEFSADQAVPIHALSAPPPSRAQSVGLREFLIERFTPPPWEF